MSERKGCWAGKEIEVEWVEWSLVQSVQTTKPNHTHTHNTVAPGHRKVWNPLISGNLFLGHRKVQTVRAHSFQGTYFLRQNFLNDHLLLKMMLSQLSYYFRYYHLDCPIDFLSSSPQDITHWTSRPHHSCSHGCRPRSRFDFTLILSFSPFYSIFISLYCFFIFFSHYCNSNIFA